MLVVYRKRKGVVIAYSWHDHACVTFNQTTIVKATVQEFLKTMAESRPDDRVVKFGSEWHQWLLDHAPHKKGERITDKLNRSGVVTDCGHMQLWQRLTAGYIVETERHTHLFIPFSVM